MAKKGKAKKQKGAKGEAAPGASQTASPPRSLTRQLLEELWAGESPFLFADPRQVDRGYPDCDLQPELVEAILLDTAPRLWLELGTMLGDSAMRTAECVKRLGLETTICCVDPFTGDFNMWLWEKARRESGDWRYLKLEAGRPTIYERFAANVRHAGHEDVIVPIHATALVGLRILENLVMEGRLDALPEVIYLDAAHEPEETLLELRRAWALLAPGGVLFGDDWLWPSVRHDVQHFARTVTPDTGRMVAFLRRFEDSHLDGNVFLYRGHWVLFKPAELHDAVEGAP